MVQRLYGLATSIKREFVIYRAIAQHPRTPRAARICLGLAIGYTFLPFDLIPDFIPVIGQLDDLIIVPGLIWLALRLVPRDVAAECRSRVQLSSSDRSGRGVHGK